VLDQIASAKNYILDNKLNLIAIAAPHRVEDFPDTPTFSELGFAQINHTSTYMIVAPKSLPAEITNKLRQSINQILQKPETLTFFKQHGLLLHTNNQDLQTNIKEEYNFYRNIVTSLNLHLVE